MTVWISEWNRTHGIYFHANPARRQAFTRRAKEYQRDDGTFDLLAFQYVSLDLDPPPDVSPDEWERIVTKKLSRLKMAPTLVWRSGNGMQCAWRVMPAVPIDSNETVKAAKAVCKGMAQAVKSELGLESDSVASLEHLFRLPGTVNWPNATKRAKGRVPVLAGPYRFRKVGYPMSAFPKAEEKPRPPSHGLTEPVDGWDALANLPYARALCLHTEDVSGEGKSGTALRTALRLRDLGVSEDTAFDLMWTLWVPRGTYDWDEDELRSKIDWAYKHAENDPGCRTPAYRTAEARRDFED